MKHEMKHEILREAIKTIEERITQLHKARDWDHCSLCRKLERQCTKCPALDAKVLNCEKYCDGISGIIKLLLKQKTIFEAELSFIYLTSGGSQARSK